MPASQLINDLNHVPNIVGALGLSIAAAQKALDASYLDGVERLLAAAKMLLAPVKADGTVLTPDEQKAVETNAATVKDLLLTFAPSRYQFTETTVDVKLDLAQSLSLSGSVGLGMGIGAVSVNAAFTLGYASDYRAAAECRTVISAYAANTAVFSALLDRAKQLSDKALVLPDRTDVDQKFIDQSASVFEKITGVAVKKAAPAA